MIVGSLQRMLQGAFMRVEGLFNAAFGDRLNPLYHLGSISFFLFWVIAGSGLYLYAFFETGVAGAYQSVEALTHGQWFAGGVLRSVHRYASDAFALTMLLHMSRHFAFDRLRGFRAFSWLTGVILIWLVYASGINGYMLPWDRLAQYVITASFEWLDWLPGLSGTLMRNFTYASSVNDRFFSLLAFMHIGIPLLVLLLMWVHVQRVPKARTAPPRPLIHALLATLLVMAAVAPVTSQGGAADMARAVEQVALDWFYLPLLPLITSWNLLHVWILVGAGTALFVLLPWVGGQRRARGEFAVEVHAGGLLRTVRARAGETLLEAGLREGLALPWECRNGGCGVCLCTVTHGEVDLGAYQPRALPDVVRRNGGALMCCATPRSDLGIEVALAAAPAAERITARIAVLERLAPEVMRVVLDPPSGVNPDFRAGQYVNIILEDGQRRAFSFANAPGNGPAIELHVRLIPGGRFTPRVFDTLKVGDTLDLEGPLGDFVLRDGTRPILFVAGATGFAPVKSILEDAFARGISRPMWLYWGVRRRHDLYMHDLAEAWQRDHPNFHFVPVLSEAAPEDRWEGRAGLVHTAMMADFPDLTGHEVYVCGSVKMVEAAVPAFIAQGLSEEVCFTDAFAPAVRRAPA